MRDSSYGDDIHAVGMGIELEEPISETIWRTGGRMSSEATQATGAAVIQMQAFGYTYQGAGRPAVDNLHFTVGRGEIFGFLGPSGAGKSTTQNVLIGLLRGYEGTITVLGRDLRGWDRSYYQRIGVAFEAPNHYKSVGVGMRISVVHVSSPLWCASSG